MDAGASVGDDELKQVLLERMDALEVNHWGLQCSPERNREAASLSP